MNSELINLREVDFAYSSAQPVLQRTDFCLIEGDRVALVGANGSGKTTLLHLLVGLLKPDSGEIEIFGRVREDEEDFWEVRERTGLLFQDPDDQLFCPTVAEDVAFGPLNLGKPREKVDIIVSEVLEELGLSGYEERITYKLSGGEKRLVSLACVLAMEPEVLLLDEPVAGLDDEMWDRLVSILKSLPQAMVVVSHDRRFLREVCNKSVRLHAGQIEPFDLDNPIAHSR
ncbi:MAG: ABC transporter ATP-binding protein [Planctomycetes bacterium]|nr:ABC transporter ATP-binding protein [Planctomycetota bacterium]